MKLPAQSWDLQAEAESVLLLQEKKKAEEQRQRELNELFAQAIKQPKLPVGVPLA